MKPRFQWLAKAAAWLRSGRAVTPTVPREAAEAVIAQTRADMALIAERIASGEALELIQADFGRAIGRNILANQALARGGFDNLSPADIARAEGVKAAQLEYLDGFLADVAKGKLSAKQIAARAGSYAESGRPVYENERLSSQKEAGMGEACRILGNLDHCEDCVEWAALGWIDIEEMESNYAIASSICGQRCGCSIVTRRTADSPSAPAVDRAIEAAQTKQAAYQAAKAAKENDE